MPLEWIVLDTSGEKVLLLSEQCISAMPFHYKAHRDLCWETSQIREWLNDYFLHRAFPQQDWSSILFTTCPQNAFRDGYRMRQHAPTSDQIFLLSSDELRKYFDPGEKTAMKLSIYNRKAPITPYASPSCEDFDSPNCTAGWWLRTQESPAKACCVNSSGREWTELVTRKLGVRPAMWVQKKALYS